MSNYHEERKNHDIEMIRIITDDMPAFVKEYVRSIQFRTTAKTRLEYVKDIRNFFEYISDANCSVKNITL